MVLIVGGGYFIFYFYNVVGMVCWSAVFREGSSSDF